MQSRDRPTSRQPRSRLKTLNEEVMRGFEAPLLMLFAAVLLLLMIGCANDLDPHARARDRAPA